MSNPIVVEFDRHIPELANFAWAFAVARGYDSDRRAQRIANADIQEDSHV